MKKILLALATFSGTIIGVGLFGLPYVAAKIGFWPIFFYFLFLGLVVIIVQLMYGEICLRTPEKHRLPGYAEIYLGRIGKIIAFFALILGLYGALLAYVIIGGKFLADLFIPLLGGNVLLYSLIFFTLGVIIVYLGRRIISEAEFFSLFLFFTILLFLLVKSLPHFKVDNFFSFDWHYLFLPYGVIIFSLWGMAVIPEIKEILENQKKSLKKVIIIGSIIPIIAYLIFIIMILGATGKNTTPEALEGLDLALGDNIVTLGFLFGILTTFTSFLTLGLNLKNSFHLDIKLPYPLAWFLACFPPLFLYLLGLENFIKVISLVGAVALGTGGILILLIFLKAKTKGKIIPEYQIKLSRPVIYFLIILLILGIFAELFFVI